MKFHLIGICGTGMGALAGLLQEADHDVRGSDEHAYPPMSTQLAQLGVEVMEGFRPENLDWQPDFVVVGNVCRRDHVEVLAARERKLELTSFPAVLKEHFLGRQSPVVIVGTHGKTTCTSLLAWLLHRAGRDPSFLVGGIPMNFEESYHLGDGPHFVLEGDEYDTAFFDKGSKFLHYRPRSALLTGVEFDHADIFDGIEAIQHAFGRFVTLIPPEGTLIVYAGSADAVQIARQCVGRVEAYGLDDDPAPDLPLWRGRVIQRDRHASQVEIRRDDTLWGRFWTTLSGDHNLLNLVGCVALGSRLGLRPEEVEVGLSTFQGVRRRQQVRGVAMGVTVIDDFAHHPTAVRATLEGLRPVFDSGRLIAVFEPRSATSRRAVFQKDYAAAFEPADTVIIGRPYDQSRIPEDDRLNPEGLVTDIRGLGLQAHYLEEVDDIVEHLATRLRPGDGIVVMSSGSFGNIHRKLLERIGDAVMPAEATDRKDLEALFTRVGLQMPDFDKSLSDYIVLRDTNGLAGCIGLERQEESGLLKDLSLIPERRGEGLSWLLADAAVKAAARMGLRRVYMFGVPETIRTGEALGFFQCDGAEIQVFITQSDHIGQSWYTKGICFRLDL